MTQTPGKTRALEPSSQVAAPGGGGGYPRSSDSVTGLCCGECAAIRHSSSHFAGRAKATDPCRHCKESHRDAKAVEQAVSLHVTLQPHSSYAPISSLLLAISGSNVHLRLWSQRESEADCPEASSALSLLG